MNSSENKPAEPEAPKKKHISPSQVNLYTKCGEAWRRRYVKREILPPGISMVRGTSIHRGAEFNFKQKIDSRVDVKPAEFVDYSVASFETAILTDGLLLNREEEAVGRSKVIGDAKDSTAAMADVYAKAVAPKYQPKEVELSARIELPSSSHDLLSIADMVTEDDTIVENKTGKRWSQDQADNSVQVTFQAMTFRALKKRDPAKIVIENIVANKTPVPNALTTDRNDDDYAALINRINAVLEGINKGIFAPANEGAWWCSPRFCGYHSTCPYVRKR